MVLTKVVEKREIAVTSKYIFGDTDCINSQLSRHRGQNTRFSLVGPAKVKASKSFVFTQKFLVVVENIEHLLDFVIHFYFLSLCFNALCSSKVSHIINFGFSKVCDQNGDRVSKNDKICHICILAKKVF